MTDRSSPALRVMGPRATLLGAQDSLESITTTTLPDGALCWVTDEETRYGFQRDSVEAPASPTIIAPAIGPGRWVAETGSIVDSVEPLRGAYFVDPLFVGVSTGSASNPFTSITAAFGFAVSAGLTNVTIFLAPGSNSIENVTFPLTGEWNIVGLLSPGNLSACIITGTVDISASANARRWLRDVRIIGNVTGNTSAGTQRVTLERVTVTGTTTLTVSGAGTVRIGSLGGVPALDVPQLNMGYTTFGGAVAVQGTIWVYTASFGSTLSCSGRCTFSNCSFLGDISTTAEVADDNTLVFNHCVPLTGIAINVSQTVPGRLALVIGSSTSFDNTTINFTGVGINFCSMDASSARTMFAHGATMTGSVVAATMAAARLTAQTDNIGVTTFAFKSPIPQLRANGTLTLTTPGTSGNAVLNITYTDSIGVVRTKPVTPALNIAGAAGDEAQGSLLFTQDGTSTYQYSVTGIVTPGALRYSVGISLEPGM